MNRYEFVMTLTPEEFLTFMTTQNVQVYVNIMQMVNAGKLNVVGNFLKVVAMHAKEIFG